MNTKPANVERSFQRSIIIMVSAASLVLANAEESPLPAALTPLVAIFSYLFVERLAKLRLPVSAANVLGAIAFMAMGWEISGNTLLGKLLSGAHLLVYITWVVLLIQKGIRQYWWLAALSVLQLAVASVLTTSGTFGASLIGMLAMMLWTLSLFTLYRGRIRVSQSLASDDNSINAEDSLAEEEVEDSPVLVRHGLQVDSSEPWIGWRFRGIVGFAFCASLTVGLVTFVVFPRVWMPNSPLAGLTSPAQQALVSQTGFTENVQLGAIGRIMQSDSRVLQFEISDEESGQPVAPDTFAQKMRMDEVLFRGNALGQYSEGRWSNEQKSGGSLSEQATRRRFRGDDSNSDFRMSIVQDAPVGRFAFAPSPVIKASTEDRRLNIGWLPWTYSLRFVPRSKVSPEQNDAPIGFSVVCRAPDSSQEFHSTTPNNSFQGSGGPFSQHVRRMVARKVNELNFAGAFCISPDIETTLPKLTGLAKQLCDEGPEQLSPRESAQRIFRYLNSSGKFQYSMLQSIQDPLIDPVEDFLTNGRTGHCEYFASAAALMMQAVGVPARVVNGYKGYEVNSVSGNFEVKQKHAHTWVEAYLDGRWETFDPTPAAAREEEVSKTSQLAWWKDLVHFFGDGWRDFISSMSPQKQEAIARPWILAAKEKWKTFREQGPWELLKEFWREIVMHPELWFSPTTGVITFFVLLVIGLIAKQSPHRWLLNKLQGWLQTDAKHRRSVVRFYENFRDVCKKNGLPLPDHQTAQENALMVQQHFGDVLTAPQDGAMPMRIATAFNRVRFGHATLTDQDLSTLKDDVTRLGEVLRTNLKPSAANLKA